MKKNDTTVERTSEREVVITRTFNAPAHIVFEAWTKPELMRRWWVPASSGITLQSCEMDVRTGGTYRFVFPHPAAPEGMAFFGRYLEVSPHTRLVWTNDESGDAGQVSTMTLEDRGDTTRMVLRELYPSKEALDAAAGAYDAMPESFDQLDELLRVR
jgi:uncharacterized protein YndB with AHSA1/START domain